MTQKSQIEYGNHFVSIKGHSVGWNVFDLGQIFGIFFALGLADQVSEYLLDAYHSHSVVPWWSGQLSVTETYLLTIVQIVHLYIWFFFSHGLSPNKIYFQN